MKKFRLKIATPENIIFNENIDMVIVRTVDGDIGIMDRHTPLVSLLGKGKIKIKRDGVIQEAFIDGGYIHVKGKNTIIMCDYIEWKN